LASQLDDQTLYLYGDVFRFDISVSHFGRLIFQDVGQDFATGMQRLATQDGSDPAKENAEKIADTVFSLKVERGVINGDDPRGGGKTATRLIDIVRLLRMQHYKCPIMEAEAVIFAKMKHQLLGRRVVSKGMCKPSDVRNSIRRS